MTVDARGNSHKAAGRPDGGQFDRKAGQGSDDDLDLDEADARLAAAMPGMDADGRRMLIEAAMNAKASRRRVETLMELKPTAARMPKIGAHDTTHDIAAKFGRYMLSGLDDDQRAEADARVASAYMRALELEPADTSGDRLVEWLKANKTKGSVTAGVDKDGVLHLLSTEPWAKGWRGQTTAWMRGDKSGTRRTIRTVDVPTLVAASRLDVDDDQLTAVLMWRGKDDPADVEYLKSMREHGYHTPELDRRIAVSDAIHGFRKALDARWSLEESRAENRRFTDRHSAGVFEDKIHCDTAHRKAAADCRLAGRYAHVELDDSVDLEGFARLDAEMEDLRRRHCLPVISPDNSFRFRLCGRHRAIGVYSPVDHAIAIDPRAPRSGAHEMAHAFDFEHGQLSASPEFRDILDRQRAALKNLDGISDSKRRYYATPTEVLARSAELYLLWTGRGSSLTSKSVDDLVAFDPSVRPLLDQRDAIVAFFDKVGLVG